MQPDSQLAMRQALALGPDHCPANLFVGAIDQVLLGLKAHATTVAHARHVTLEESYPRTCNLLGVELFHARAADYLERPCVALLPCQRIGLWFADSLSGEARDLARLEWAWLECHGAADEPAFDLSAVGTLTAEEVVAARVVRHSAASLLPIAEEVEFDGTRLFPPFVLMTRPGVEVLIRDVTFYAADLFARLERPISLGELFEADAVATHQMVAVGALALASETRS